MEIIGRKKGGEEKKCHVHVLGTIITVADRTTCWLRRMVIRGTVTAMVRVVILRTVTRRMAIRHTVTTIARTVIHTMGGTIPGLGTATVRMDIRTIGDQNIETKPNRLERAPTVLDLFSLIKFPALNTQAVSSRAA